MNCTILLQEMLLIFRSPKCSQKLSVWHFVLGINCSQLLLGVYHAHYYVYSQLLPCAHYYVYTTWLLACILFSRGQSRVIQQVVPR